MKKWSFVNHGTFYNCINLKTKQSSNQGGKGNLVSYNFSCKVEFEYLKLIGENANYVNWSVVGVEQSLLRKKYIDSIGYKIIHKLCGFNFPEHTLNI